VKARRVVVFSLAALLLLAVVWVVGGNMWAAHREERCDRAWTATFGSLEDLKKKYPTRATNETAMKLEELTRGTVFDLTPVVGSVERGRHPGSGWNRSQGAVDFLLAQIAKPEAAIDPPGEEAIRFLEEKRAVVDAIETLLTAGPPPEWALDVSIPAEERRMPNVLGQIRIQRILLARALAAAQGGRTNASARSLEASWNLNESIRGRPETIPALIGIAVARLEVGALRKIDVPRDNWAPRLAAMGIRARLVDAIVFNHSRLTNSAARYRRLRPAGVGWWAHNFASLVEEPRDRLADADYDEAFRRALAGLRDEPAFRNEEPETPPGKSATGVKISIVIPNLRNSFQRADQLALEAELTGKILRVKEVRRARGAWPDPSPEIASSRFPGFSWSYAVANDAMTISLAGQLPKPPSPLVLPTSFSSRAPAP
jgi:hypothetical protein